MIIRINQSIFQNTENICFSHPHDFYSLGRIFLSEFSQTFEGCGETEFHRLYGAVPDSQRSNSENFQSHSRSDIKKRIFCFTPKINFSLCALDSKGFNLQSHEFGEPSRETAE